MRAETKFFSLFTGSNNINDDNVNMSPIPWGPSLGPAWPMHFPESVDNRLSKHMMTN